MPRSISGCFRRIGLFSLVAVCLGGIGLTGCRSSGRIATSPDGGVVRLACLYDQKPWLSLDKAGDRDPEGIQYFVFADEGAGLGVFVEGTLMIELYEIQRDAKGEIVRTMVSDWILPTDKIDRIKSKMWGKGYHVRLRWAKKSLAGHEIEIVTRFRNKAGAVASAGIKRFRVPKYSW